jgi:hypothetical protein
LRPKDTNAKGRTSHGKGAGKQQQKEEKSTPSMEEKLTAMEKELVERLGSKKVDPPEGIRVRIYLAPKR